METNLFYSLCQHPQRLRDAVLYAAGGQVLRFCCVWRGCARDGTHILGKVVQHSRRSAGAIAPAARKIIRRLSPERKLDSTEILREVI